MHTCPIVQSHYSENCRLGKHRSTGPHVRGTHIDRSASASLVLFFYFPCALTHKWTEVHLVADEETFSASSLLHTSHTTTLFQKGAPSTQHDFGLLCSLPNRNFHTTHQAYAALLPELHTLGVKKIRLSCKVWFIWPKRTSTRFYTHCRKLRLQMHWLANRCYLYVYFCKYSYRQILPSLVMSQWHFLT